MFGYLLKLKNFQIILVNFWLYLIHFLKLFSLSLIIEYKIFYMLFLQLIKKALGKIYLLALTHENITQAIIE